MSRVFIIILDGVGVGEMPDAREYRDQGSNTLGNLSHAVGGLRLPCLESMGLGNIGDFQGMKKVNDPIASHGKMEELSKGKDTITGHWEMMGIISERPFPTYPDGFPPEIIGAFKKRINRDVLCNRPASGTEIIEELGEEHMRTGSPIVYTSADSVFQIAAHEEIITVDELYEICKTARELLVAPHNVCRVIARPFVGPPFKRTHRRKDFAVAPPEDTALDMLFKRDTKVISVGKVSDMFSGKGFTETMKTEGNADGMHKMEKVLSTLDEGLMFCNLVDFDTLYGHRNDTKGFKDALEEFDTWLPVFLNGLKDDDFLFITADHGLDPTTPSTDHSREYVPVLFYNKKLRGIDLGLRRGFWDVGATMAEIFGIEKFNRGRSFLNKNY
jgi:phosphopentomutase